HDLCSGERFADEPVLGFCSSYLVGPDLVATAGHCFKSTLCEETAFVFDFYRGGASGDVSAIPASNVYRCKQVVARQYDGQHDYALVQLDRPTTGRVPFTLQATPPAVGARVALLGFPSGILGKVDLAGKVVRVEGNRIRTSVDSFPGHSGGVMLDLASGRAFGVHIEGSTPSYVGTGTCSRAAGCAAVTPDAGSCQGAVESSVEAFSTCCGGTPPTPPATPSSCNDRCGATDGACACDLACTSRGDCCRDFATTCRAGSTSGVCLGGGAPCDASTDCADAVCACDSEHAVSESFSVPGRCSLNTCEDLQQMCAAACEHMDPVVGNERFTLGWWMVDCESR
ncbi:MAG: trypsin-like peptidase domain-containing protein, partial [Deltaproteobacteria bacterium]|nr:trypsin-like peptidase domain-containing protein [Deltaproteobacteria bacterium]